jgi:hypothetical protein
MQNVRKVSAAELQRRDRQRVMSIAKFCENYGVGRSTTYLEIKFKRLRALKCGKRTIITEDDAEDWLRSLSAVASEGAGESQSNATIEGVA